MAYMRMARNSICAGLAMLLSACGVNSVVVEGSYPTPNIRPFPMTLGVYFDDELKNYTYIEYTEEGKEEYAVSAGQTHITLFESVLPAMFEQVVILDDMSAASTARVDAVFSPHIEEFQLALPQKTRLDAYEVWVKYNMQLLRPNGDYIADWIVTSYGKTPSESLRSVESGINDATVGALRDLASNFSLSFGAVPEVREWLEAQ